MVDIVNIYKSLNVSIGTISKNPEMLRFVPGHLKLNAVDNYPHALEFVPEYFITLEM